MTATARTTAAFLLVLLSGGGCSSTEPEPDPGSIRGNVEWCWNGNCDDWTFGGDAVLTGPDMSSTDSFTRGSFSFNQIPVGRYSLQVDYSGSVYLGRLVCVPKFSPQQIEVSEGQMTTVRMQAQLACR